MHHHGHAAAGGSDGDDTGGRAAEDDDAVGADDVDEPVHLVARAQRAQRRAQAGELRLPRVRARHARVRDADDVVGAAQPREEARVVAHHDCACAAGAGGVSDGDGDGEVAACPASDHQERPFSRHRSECYTTVSRHGGER